MIQTHALTTPATPAQVLLPWSGSSASASATVGCAPMAPGLVHVKAPQAVANSTPRRSCTLAQQQQGRGLHRARERQGWVLPKTSRPSTGSCQHCRQSLGPCRASRPAPFRGRPQASPALR